MIPIVTPAQMGAIDAAAPEPVEVLIERAGAAVARSALELLGGAYGRTVTIIAGKGNNGADGRAAARRLAARGVRCTVIPAAEVPSSLPPADLVIDAAYGTGMRGRWPAPDVGPTPVLAVDIPSGVDGLTGVADGPVLPATRTVTFQALKPGLLLGDGPRLAGEVVVADIGLDTSTATQHLLEEVDVARWWPSRSPDDHKWRHAVRVVAGNASMTGAAALCANAAARAGASLVTLSIPAADGPSPLVRPEVIQTSMADADAVLADIGRFAALVVGPGLGRSPLAAAVASACFAAPVPLVVDGDALTALAGRPDALAARTHPTVLTPHDGELDRLIDGIADTAPVASGTTASGTFNPTAVPDRRADRVAAVVAVARAYRATVLAKGPTTIVAGPLGDQNEAVWYIDHGDERLATAGTGDVLAGIVAAALAGGLSADRAAAAAAWLHAEAGRLGPRRGLLAGDLVDTIAVAQGNLERIAGRGGSPASTLRGLTR